MEWHEEYEIKDRKGRPIETVLKNERGTVVMICVLTAKGNAENWCERHQRYHNGRHLITSLKVSDLVKRDNCPGSWSGAELAVTQSSKALRIAYDQLLEAISNDGAIIETRIVRRPGVLEVHASVTQKEKEIPF